QSNCLPDTVSGPVHGPGLECPYSQGGIPQMPPQKLALLFRWLPPILYKLHRHAISSYSKAPRGLSVLSRVMRIFTHSIISPGLSLRQCPSRCTFRAGRNLPDKEFRYLRTVIVTAAVYWGLSSALRSRRNERFPSTFQHRAGVSPYTSPYGFAETCVFDKQSLGPIHCGSNKIRAPLLPKLRGHFAEFLNESSPAHLRILSSPTCVGLRYGHLFPHQRIFLAVWNQELRYYSSLPITAQDELAGFAYPTP